MNRVISTKQFLRDLVKELADDNVPQGAAALAYYLTLAIFPAMILLMTTIPYLPIDDVDQAIMDLFGQALPKDAYSLVESVVVNVTSNRRGGLLSFSAIVTLWAASSGMFAVMKQLNITYGVKESRGLFKGRAIAILLSVLFGLLIIGAFTLIVIGGMVEDWLGARLGFSDALLLLFALFRWIVIVLALLLAFAMIYRYAPNVEERFAFISPGSFVGVVLLIGASLLFTIYTSNFGNYDATYGSIGAVIVLMLWLYIAGFVVLLGSEINALIKRYRYSGSAEGRNEGRDYRGETSRESVTRFGER